MHLKNLILMAILSVGMTVGAHAQETPRPQVLDEVFECRNIADDTARLNCFDRAVGNLQSAEQAGQLVAVDTVQARRIEREAFGFNLPSLTRILPNLIGGGGDEAPVEDVALTISRVRERGYQRFVFEMENGQVWTSVEAINANDVRHFRRGAEVTVRSASIGSFLMSGQYGRAHRVQRER
jgi:hypothetical protein